MAGTVSNLLHPENRQAWNGMDKVDNPEKFSCSIFRLFRCLLNVVSRGTFSLFKFPCVFLETLYYQHEMENSLLLDCSQSYGDGVCFRR